MVLSGAYEVFNAKNSNQVISRTDWTGLLPGMSITMAVIIKQRHREAVCHDLAAVPGFMLKLKVAVTSGTCTPCLY